MKKLKNIFQQIESIRPDPKHPSFTELFKANSKFMLALSQEASLIAWINLGVAFIALIIAIFSFFKPSPKVEQIFIPFGYENIFDYLYIKCPNANNTHDTNPIKNSFEIPLSTPPNPSILAPKVNPNKDTEGNESAKKNRPNQTKEIETAKKP